MEKGNDKRQVKECEYLIKSQTEVGDCEFALY